MNFNPKFTKVHDIDVCADLINQPHEDYPDRVGYTAFCIAELIVQFRECINGYRIASISEFDCKSIHSVIMHDMDDRNRGQWRNVPVTVGNDTPCQPWMIPSEIEEARLFPMNFTAMDDSDIIRWYRQFQIIHPFKDGNGRVGGVIVAVATYINSDGEYLLAPMQ